MLAKGGIRSDPFFVVILECASERVGHDAAADAVAQRHADGPIVRERRFEYLGRQLEQRPPAGVQDIGRILLQRAVVLDLDVHDLGFVFREVRCGDFEHVDRLEQALQRPDADIRSRCQRFHAPTHDVFHCSSQDRERLVDRIRLGVIARIEPQRPIPCRQEHEAAPEGAVAQRIPPVGACHIEREHHTSTPHVLNQPGIVLSKLLQSPAGALAGAAHLLQIDPMQRRQQTHHANGFALPGRVELLLFLEERRHLFAHKQHAVLRLLGPDHDIRRHGQFEQLMRPHAPGGAPARLNLVEHERNIVNTGEQPQPSHESRACEANASLPLDRLDQHRRDPAAASDGVGTERRALGEDERGRVRAGRRQERVDRVQLATERLLALLGVRQAARDQEVPDLLEALFLTARRFFRFVVEHGKRHLGPVERGKSEASLLPVRHREAAQRSTVERTFERDDEATVRVARRFHAIEEDGLDRILHRLGAGVDHEVARRPRRRDAVQLGFQLQRHRGLVLRVRIARERVRQMVQHRFDDRGIVLTEGLGGDERTHVEKAIRLALRVAIDCREERANRMGRVEGHRQRVEQALRCRFERGFRSGQVFLDEVVQWSVG